MQAVMISPFSLTFKDSHSSDSNEFAEISGKLAEDLRGKLKIEDESLRSEVMVEQKVVVDAYEKEEAEDEEEEEEFSFCTNPDGSPISAEEVFDKGQIRPTFPLFNRDLLFIDSYEGNIHDGSLELQPPVKKYFIRQPGLSSSSSSESDEEPEGPSDEEPEGPYCEWSGKAAAENSSERCKKSNSTGFSKLRRFRDLVRRSSSDGKDAFVFLNASTTNSSSTEANKSKRKTVKSVVPRTVKASSGAKGKTATSAHEKHYVLNRARKEGDKRKSYLPYKVGFFTSVNGMSRNVHPF